MFFEYWTHWLVNIQYDDDDDDDDIDIFVYIYIYIHVEYISIYNNHKTILDCITEKQIEYYNIFQYYWNALTMSRFFGER